MTLAPPSAVLFDEILDFLTSQRTPEQIVAFQPPEALQQQLSALLDRNRQGSLTPEEQSELDEFLRMNRFMSRLRSLARKKLKSTTDADALDDSDEHIAASFQRAWHEAMTGQTHPVSTLWDDWDEE
jgi:hypothetical protein